MATAATWMNQIIFDLLTVSDDALEPKLRRMHLYQKGLTLTQMQYGTCCTVLLNRRTSQCCQTKTGPTANWLQTD